MAAGRKVGKIFVGKIELKNKIYMGLKSRVEREIFNFMHPMPVYKPLRKSRPINRLDVPSAWSGLEEIIESLLIQFSINRDSCIEFGTEYGYSTVAFSNYFDRVKGVDLFLGDAHSGLKTDHYNETKALLSQYPNIELVQADFRDYVLSDNNHYNLAHVDIVHTYQETFDCGYWALQHSDCCLFHDTNSFKEVRQAVIDLAKVTGRKLYNYPHHHGLGIII